MIAYTTQKLLISVLSLSLVTGAIAQPQKVPGQLEHEINCKACHLLDTVSVGPSLVAIAETYPAGKTKEFINWAKAPGKKNPRMIQMPAMAHIPDDTLELIHKYLLNITAGKKEKKGRRKFKPFKEPKRDLPYVVRAFLPDASPASVAVFLEKNTGICWDTETCHLAYAWKGNKTNINSYFGPTKLQSTPFYKETSPHLFEEFQDQKPEFLGYRLIKGYPEFHYKLGELEIKELITNTGSGQSFGRRFKIIGVKANLTLNLTHKGQVAITADKGNLNNNLLSLSAVDAQTFTLTISKK